MYVTYQKSSFDIFPVGNFLNIFMEDLFNTPRIFGIKSKSFILIHAMYFLLVRAT